jgi:hypothetical protein
MRPLGAVRDAPGVDNVAEEVEVGQVELHAGRAFEPSLFEKAGSMQYGLSAGDQPGMVRR